MPADPPNEGGQQAAQAPIFSGNVPVPPQIELSGNLANNWKQWKQVWSAYELVTRLNERYRFNNRNQDAGESIEMYSLRHVQLWSA